MLHPVVHSLRLCRGNLTRLRASFTVEASLVMPTVLLVLLLVLFLSAHIHNRAVLTASACEQAVSGHEQEVTVLFLENEFSCERSSDTKKREITYKLLTVPYLSGRKWEETASAVYEIADPAVFLHKLAALKGSLPDNDQNG